ncbi:hypothetical protein AVEN_207092-1, partial [Araneus ventricosus]
YVNYDKDIMTLKLLTIDELIEEKLCGANLGDVEELIPSSFKDAMDSIEKLRTYFLSSSSDRGSKLRGPSQNSPRVAS